MDKKKVLKATNSPKLKLGNGIPVSFCISMISSAHLLVFGNSANITLRPIMIQQHSVAPIYTPPAVSTTVAWNPVKCFLNSIE